MEDSYRGIVPEVLTKDNYQRWKILTKNYLRGKGLWVVVEHGFNSRKPIQSMKDAEALHIIQLSCGSKVFDEIKHFQTAKEAWNFLAWLYSSELKAEPDMEQGVHSLYNRELCILVEKGNWEEAELLIEAEGNEVLLSPSDVDNRTVLHVAAMAGHLNVVRGLVSIPQGERLLQMKDNSGYTALALVADLTGNKDVAKCMLEFINDDIRHNLLTTTNIGGKIPLLLAAHKRHKRMTRYLFNITPREVLNELDDDNRVQLLQHCIEGEIFDVALSLLQSYLRLDQLACESLKFDCFRALLPLTKMPAAFFSGCRYGCTQRFIYNILRVEKKFLKGEKPRGHKSNFGGRFCGPVFEFLLRPVRVCGRFCGPVFEFLLRPVRVCGGFFLYGLIEIFRCLHLFGTTELYEQKCTHSVVQRILWHMQISVERMNNLELKKALVYEAMLNAAKHGIVEFINAMTVINHDLLWAKDTNNRDIFSYAILHRKQEVFQLISTLNGRKDIIKYRRDVFGNNMLHLAGYLGPSSDLDLRSGAALQMQREIQWFKAVEKVVHDPKRREARNDDGKKPRELFTENHKELVKEGERWAKQAAKSFALVGILITTVMFAAAFTVPGGNDQVTGVPIFLNDRVFTTFVAADAISLFTSATSVLIFIWILTSRFAEGDFLKMLPWKLLSGLGFLSLSVVCMLVAFCAALDVVLKKYWAYNHLYIVGIIMGCIPLIVLVWSQLKLSVKILRSTLSNLI